MNNVDKIKNDIRNHCLNYIEDDVYAIVLKKYAKQDHILELYIVNIIINTSDPKLWISDVLRYCRCAYIIYFIINVLKDNESIELLSSDVELMDDDMLFLLLHGSFKSNIMNKQFIKQILLTKSSNIVKLIIKYNPKYNKYLLKRYMKILTIYSCKNKHNHLYDKISDLYPDNYSHINDDYDYKDDELISLDQLYEKRVNYIDNYAPVTTFRMVFNLTTVDEVLFCKQTYLRSRFVLNQTYFYNKQHIEYINTAFRDSEINMNNLSFADFIRELFE